MNTRSFFVPIILASVICVAPIVCNAAPAQQAYVKASNTDPVDNFGTAIAISGDTIVVGAPNEDSDATIVNGHQTNASFGQYYGAAYVLVRAGNNWTQQAYLKASNAGSEDIFGWSVAISGDTIVVGAPYENNNATGVNGNQTNGLSGYSGAAYVFVRSGTNWTQQAYLKASNTGAFDLFGWSVAISSNTIVVGARDESSNATQINGDQTNNAAQYAGAAYVFVRSGTTWSQQAYLKASNAQVADRFGWSVAIDGETIVVGARTEDSNAINVNGNDSDNSAAESGAAYVFVRNGGNWSQQAYLKAVNTDQLDVFGASVSISGETVVVGAPGEFSSGTSGAAYVFVRNGTNWSPQAHLKSTSPSITQQNFGYSLGVAGDILVVGANVESGDATGVNGTNFNLTVNDAGAAFAFVRSGTNWSNLAYLKASNTGQDDQFGYAVAVSGDTVVAGALGEGSNATGINGNQTNELADSSGAAYVFTGFIPSSPISFNLANAEMLAGGGGFRLRFPNTSGGTFTVWASTNITMPHTNWTSLGSPTEISPGQYQFTDSQAGFYHWRFYRVTSP